MQLDAALLSPAWSCASSSIGVLQSYMYCLRLGRERLQRDPPRVDPLPRQVLDRIVAQGRGVTLAAGAHARAVLQTDAPRKQVSGQPACREIRWQPTKRGVTEWCRESRAGGFGSHRSGAAVLVRMELILRRPAPLAVAVVGQQPVLALALDTLGERRWNDRAARLSNAW